MHTSFCFVPFFCYFKSNTNYFKKEKVVDRLGGNKGTLLSLSPVVTEAQTDCYNNLIENS